MKGGYSQDYYRLLGVADDADTATIKRAYRQHIARHHPDRQANSDEDVVHQLNTAYAILKDDKVRRQYDRQLPRIRQKQWLWQQRAKFYEVKQGFGYVANTALVNLGKQQFNRLIVDAHHTKHMAQITQRAAMHLGRIWQRFTDVSAKLGYDTSCTIGLHTVYEGGEILIHWQGKRFKVVLPAGLSHGDIITVQCHGSPVRLRIQTKPVNIYVKGLDINYVIFLSPNQAANGDTVVLPKPIGLTLTIPPNGKYPTKIMLSNQGLRQMASVGDVIVHLNIT